MLFRSPIWIPGGGSVDTWDYCADNDLVYCYLSYFGYKAGLATMRGFWDKMAERGKPLNPFQGAFAQFVAVADSEKEAFELYREPAEYFFNSCLHVYAGFADPPGYKTPNTVRAGVEGMVERAAREATARSEAKAGAKASADKPAMPKSSSSSQMMSFETMVEKGYVVLGSPDQVIEKLTEVGTSMNVGHLLTLAHFGNMDPELVRFNTEMLARKVLPEVQPLFENEWEDRWWPKPLPSALRAEPGR